MAFADQNKILKKNTTQGSIQQLDADFFWIIPCHIEIMRQMEQSKTGLFKTWQGYSNKWRKDKILITAPKYNESLQLY